MVDFENFDSKFVNIAKSKEFQENQKLYNQAKHVFLIGHGGNMSIAEHAAIDGSRLTDKNIYAPGGGVIVTSIQGDTNFNDWMMNWLKIRIRGLDLEECLVIGLSCSTTGKSSDCVCTALNWCVENNIKSVLWAAQPKEKGVDKRILQVVQNAKYYHTSELLSLALTYQLIHGSGFECPSIFKKAKERRFENLGIKSEISQKYEKFDNKLSSKDVPPGMENQQMNLAIDFDGVIHNFDKGWHDGTCYGDPIEGSLEAIKKLSEKYNLIIFSAKVRPDRPLVDNKTGKELVCEWLKKHGVMKYIQEVTHEKPRAKYYIDDKALEFKDNWFNILERVM
tara:strand:+ start:3140 stop:4147 length:1008 start_codon:yes stop_codon:yes gene_type:complete